MQIIEQLTVNYFLVLYMRSEIALNIPPFKKGDGKIEQKHNRAQECGKILRNGELYS